MQRINEGKEGRREGGKEGRRERRGFSVTGVRITLIPVCEVISGEILRVPLASLK